MDSLTDRETGNLVFDSPATSVHTSDSELPEGFSARFWQDWLDCEPILFRHALKWCSGDRDSAWEVIRESMFRAGSRYQRLDHPPGHPMSWFLRQTYWSFLDYERANKRRIDHHRKSTDGLYARSDRLPTAESPEAGIERRQRAGWVHSELDKLPERLRRVMVLRWLGEMDYAEIASHLQSTPESARKQAQEAHDLLRTRLSADSNLPRERPVNAFPEPDPDRRASISAVSQANVFQFPFDTHGSRLIRLKLQDGLSRLSLLFTTSRPVRLRQKVAGLERYIAQHPGGWKKRMALGIACFELGDLEKAHAAFSFVSKRQIHLPAPEAWLGRLAMLKGEATIAQTHFLLAAGRTKVKGEQGYFEGWAAFAAGNAETAVHRLNESHDSHSGFPYPADALAMTLFSIQDYPALIPESDGIRYLPAQSLAQLVFRALAALASDQAALFHLIVRHLVSSRPQDTISLILGVLANCREVSPGNDEVKDARKLLRRFNRANPNSVVGLLLKAELEHLQSRDDHVLAVLRQLEPIAGECLIAASGLLEWNLRLGHFTMPGRQVEVLERAPMLNPFQRRLLDLAKQHPDTSAASSLSALPVWLASLVL